RRPTPGWFRARAAEHCREEKPSRRRRYRRGSRDGRDGRRWESFRFAAEGVGRSYAPAQVWPAARIGRRQSQVGPERRLVISCRDLRGTAIPCSFVAESKNNLTASFAKKSQNTPRVAAAPCHATEAF